jgi:hypothetical protein
MTRWSPVLLPAARHHAGLLLRFHFPAMATPPIPPGGLIALDACVMMGADALRNTTIATNGFGTDWE